MGIPAVPRYITEDDLKGLPPGHRFSLFLPVWKADGWEVEIHKAQALERALECPRETVSLIRAVRDRQTALAMACEDRVFACEAESVSPFLTGIGQEHPVENGFTFMNPFGIPCLPGSGVKGVIRRAMEGMALGEWPCGATPCSLLDVWVLFGFEATSGYFGGSRLPKAEAVQKRAEEIEAAYRGALGKEKPEILLTYLSDIVEGASLTAAQKEAFRQDPKGYVLGFVENSAKTMRESMHSRGRLIFWDVYPEIAGNKMAIDILTPHYMNYYQGDVSPADCGQPIPNPFLTVPPGSRFTFHVEAARGPMPGDLGTRWRPLVASAFEKAFHWLGFGAKTAVGYGQMRPLRKLGQASSQPKGEAQEKEKPAPEPIIWENVHLSYSPGGGGVVTASCGAKKADQKKNDLKDVPASISGKLFDKRKKIDGVRVEVEPVGGKNFKLVRILE